MKVNLIYLAQINQAVSYIATVVTSTHADFLSKFLSAQDFLQTMFACLWAKRQPEPTTEIGQKKAFIPAKLDLAE